MNTTQSKPCLFCAKAPRSGESKLCNGCWAKLDRRVDWIERLPLRLRSAARAFWKEATRAD